MDALSEHPLEGGHSTEGVVRVGDTVRRPLHARSDLVHALLRHFEAVGFDGAPRLLGIDERNREVLTYVPGTVVARSPAWLSDARIASAARLIRRFHDATVGTALAGHEEVVGHSDLGPHNIIFDGEVAVAIIDWDDGVGPGNRLVDFGHAVWCCADVAEDEVPVEEQGRKVRLMCDAYGWDDPAAVIDEIAARFRRARDQHRAGGRSEAARIFEAMVAWMVLNAPALKGGTP